MDFGELLENIFKDKEGIKVSSMMKPSKDENAAFIALDKEINEQIIVNELFMVKSMSYAEELGNEKVRKRKLY